MKNIMNSVPTLWMLPILLVLLLSTACAEETGEAEDAGEQDQQGNTTPVQVEKVDIGTVEVVERSVGTVDTFTQPVVAAEVSGRIRDVAHDVGDAVEAGDVLARIEREPFQIARAGALSEVGRLQARVEQLEADLERLRRLSERDYATEQDMDSLRAELEGSRQQLDGARSRLRQAERDLRLTDIRSPIDGVVDQRHVSEGGFIAAGNPAFRIQPMNRFRAVLSFPEQVGNRLDTGMTVTLTSRGGSGGEAEGVISRLRPAVDASSRSVGVIVDFDNPGNWRPGMTVEGKVILERREDAIRVPALSLVQRPDRQVVYVLDGDQVREHPVEVGVHTPSWVEIRSGLEGTETVVTDGASFLTDGARVRQREDN